MVCSIMGTILHLKPGKKGMKQLLAQYGDRLVCALSLRYAAEKVVQDGGVDHRGTRVGTAIAAICCGHDCGSMRWLCRGEVAGPGKVGGREVES
jgi:hypothetical protein